MIRNRVQAGESGDVTILPRPMMDEVLRQGRISPGSIVDLAHSAVAVAVRTGAPKPDIRTVDAFKASLTTNKSVSYPDPTRGGATGVLVTHVFERLGMTEEMKPKTKFPPGDQFAVDVVARGEAEIAIAQPMEVLAQPKKRPQVIDPLSAEHYAAIMPRQNGELFNSIGRSRPLERRYWPAPLQRIAALHASLAAMRY